MLAVDTLSKAGLTRAGASLVTAAYYLGSRLRTPHPHLEVPQLPPPQPTLIPLPTPSNPPIIAKGTRHLILVVTKSYSILTLPYFYIPPILKLLQVYFQNITSGRLIHSRLKHSSEIETAVAEKPTAIRTRHVMNAMEGSQEMPFVKLPILF